MSHDMTEEQEAAVDEYVRKLNEQRAVRTHDKHGLSYSDGNRSFRRAVIKNRGTSKPKQYHKQGHKAY